MKKVSQVIPQEQVQILTEALNLLEVALKSIALDEDSNLHHKLFDITTLKAMLNQTELVVNLPFDVYKNFSSINPVDFPKYVTDGADSSTT
tara:strand:- start:503 stop:775 length:273 start_codon:yes stop_codon:yes gene_type:complete